MFMLNTKKIAKLPCFSYAMPTEKVLNSLSKSWKAFGMMDYVQPTSTVAANESSSGSGTTSSGVVETISVMEKFLDDVEKVGALFTAESFLTEPSHPFGIDDKVYPF